MSEEKEQAQYQFVDERQVANAAAAGLAVLGHEACVIPNRVRRSVDDLEGLLRGLTGGQLAVVARQTPAPQESEQASEAENAE